MRLSMGPPVIIYRTRYIGSPRAIYCQRRLSRTTYTATWGHVQSEVLVFEPNAVQNYPALFWSILDPGGLQTTSCLIINLCESKADIESQVRSQALDILLSWATVNIPLLVGSLWEVMGRKPA